MVSHGVLIADDRVLVAQPEFAIGWKRVFASRAENHKIGLEQNSLLRLDIRRRVALLVGSRGALKRCCSEERGSQGDLLHRIPPISINVPESGGSIRSH